MFTFLTIVLCIVLCIVGYIAVSGITHGYAKHRWPPKIERKQVYINYKYEWRDVDEHSGARLFSTILWPFYWIFIWPFTKTNEVIFSKIEKNAGAEVARNKIRIAELRATRDQLKASNDELERAEAELDKEIAKTL